MADLIDTVEMYLRTILEIEEEGGVPLRARISERLGHSGPTVSQTVGRMQRDGLVELAVDHRLQLTPLGRARAVGVMRKHRLAECLLDQVIHLDWTHLHEEACRWEHVIGEEAERRIAALLQYPHESPYGNPIPGLEELGQRPTGETFRTGAVSVLEAVRPAPAQTTVRRIGELIQVRPELLAALRDTGVVPGAQVVAEAAGEFTRVYAPGGDDGLELSRDVAEHLYVATPA